MNADREAERFWAKVQKDRASGCWLWQGALSGGYGSRGATKDTRAHTVARSAAQARVAVLEKALKKIVVMIARAALAGGAETTKEET